MRAKTNMEESEDDGVNVCLKNVHCRHQHKSVKNVSRAHHYQTIVKFIASVSWFRMSDSTTIYDRKNFFFFGCDFYPDAFPT